MKHLVVLTVLVTLASLKMLRAQDNFSAQDISLTVKDAPLEEVFAQLNQRYGYHFIYVSSVLQGLPKVSVSVRNQTIEKTMDALIGNLPLAYTRHNRVVTLVRKQAMAGRSNTGAVMITGLIYDTETGMAIPHAGVRWIGRMGGTAASAQGVFTLDVPVGADSLRFTAVGYHPHTEALNGSETYRIGMRPLMVGIEEVVVTGIVERKQESYTSATATLSGGELRQVGNGSVIQAIRTLDPSFIQVANTLQGSNPNALAQIEMRGKTSLNGLTLENQYATDPNQPLFILDGFESSLQQVTDLDINRIESVTLLKDAASASLYGARSANGVVVVETKKPKPGEMQVFVNSDYSFEVADLSDYNMMSAEEKLQFERMAGRYNPVDEIDVNPVALSSAYNDRLRKVLQGVNHYWLDVPLQVGMTNNQSVYVQRGAGSWYYGVGGNWRHRNGVMKETGRNTWGGWADLGFSKGKWRLMATTFLSGKEVFDSPTDDFSLYVKQSPLYMATDTARYLDAIPYPDRLGSYREPNYIYNALQPSFTKGLERGLQQQAILSWKPTAAWELVARAQWLTGRETERVFISPRDTRFEFVNPQERGSYTLREVRRSGYQANLMGIWNRQWNQRHFLTANGRVEIQEDDLTNRGYDLSGFPAESRGNPQEAVGGNTVLEARGSPPLIRRGNLLISANYVYDSRYFADATIRVDGSTQFGSANRYAGFWSLGVGWNIHRERFFDALGLVNILRIRASTGLTGNQSFGSFASTVVYVPIIVDPEQDQGIIHRSLGNPFLEWQRTRQTNLGVDMEMWGSRVSLSGNLFYKLTDPLIATVDLPPSTGVEAYSMNVGGLSSRGFEGTMQVSPIMRPAARWTLGATVLSYQDRYVNLTSSLLAENERLQEAQSLLRYAEGHSPDDLWAVRSLGIEPTTGREMFLTRDGKQTFDYNWDDLQVVGNARPWAEGVISTLFLYKMVSIGAYFRYVLGGSRQNEALYQKVENITFDELSANQDRRALYDRWQQEGDVAVFRGISLLEETPISSRFVQRENVLTGESLSIGVTLGDQQFDWLRKVGVDQLSVFLYANDVIRWSNIVAERGTEYPYARSFAFSVGMSF
ncbi:MAG: SusC/RagA family TonB-linked outer membrane protein [Parapedobacter sp.]|nr:MAG: SusC/RagA family TonB-linked outer membrane protein [Parapedobacter sp.]